MNRDHDFQNRIDAFIYGQTWSQNVRSKIMGYDHDSISPYRDYTSSPTRGISYPESTIIRKRTTEEALQRLQEVEIPVPPLIRRYFPIGRYTSVVQELAKVLVILDPLDRLD